MARRGRKDTESWSFSYSSFVGCLLGCLLVVALKQFGGHALFGDSWRSASAALGFPTTHTPAGHGRPAGGPRQAGRVAALQLSAEVLPVTSPSPVTSIAPAALAPGQETVIKDISLASPVEAPPHAPFEGPDTVIALARYPNSFMLKFVKSARMAGFDGRIMLGVHTELQSHFRKRLVKLGVMAMPVATTPCKLGYELPKNKYSLRMECSAELPKLKLEAARFALARKWIQACSGCTGWFLVADYSDVYFQRSPFEGMGRPHGHELIFIEEYLGHGVTDPRGEYNTHWFTHSGVKSCYGKTEADRMGTTPVLCSGSILGGRTGMLGFLERFEEEFVKNADKQVAKCDPSNSPDQGLLNYLYYTGAFAHLKPTAGKYGDSPVITVGKVCSGGKEGHSMTDRIKMEDGWVLNSDGSRGNIIHQDKVCWKNLVLPFVHPRFEAIEDDVVLVRYHAAKSLADGV